MIIKLKSLRLKNFKGIKEKTINFGQVTDILGANATGKTTIADAFRWLLFDKDSQDRSTFGIKTLDANNNVIHGLDHEVEGVLLVDSKTLTLQKTYREKWTKKRGQEQRELTGHETVYAIDEVPVKKSEYTDKINELIDENIFKLVTNPLYFNEKLNWKDRRDLLLQVIGNIDDSVIIDSKDKLKPLTTLLGDKSIEDFKKIVAARRKKLNDELKMIPVRIDEINQGLPELNIDFELVQEEIRVIQRVIDAIDNKILDESKVYEEIAKKKSVLYSKQSELQKMEHQAELEKDKPKREWENKLSTIKFEIQSKVNKVDSLKSQNVDRKATIDELEEENEKLRVEFNEAFSKELKFSQEEFICPTCRQDLPEDSKEEKKAEMLEAFKVDKDYTIKKIQEKGKKNAARIKELNKFYEEVIKEIMELEREIAGLNYEKDKLEDSIIRFEPSDTLENNTEYLKLQKEIQALKAELQTPVDTKSEELKIEKSNKVAELDNLKAKLATKQQYEKSQERIKELEAREKELAKQIAELEGQECLCEEFTRTKVDLLESRINSKFNTVRFKLFNTLVNGGLEDCCEALIDGVPFADANNAAKINAGIDIINTLSDHFDIQAPIFVDNKEGINVLVENNSQIINLIVPPTFDDLSKIAQEALIEKYGNVEKAREIYEKPNRTLRVEMRLEFKNKESEVA